MNPWSPDLVDYCVQDAIESARLSKIWTVADDLAIFLKNSKKKSIVRAGRLFSEKRRFWCCLSRSPFTALRMNASFDSNETWRKVYHGVSRHCEPLTIRIGWVIRTGRDWNGWAALKLDCVWVLWSHERECVRRRRPLSRMRGLVGHRDAGTVRAWGRLSYWPIKVSRGSVFVRGWSWSRQWLTTVGWTSRRRMFGRWWGSPWIW